MDLLQIENRACLEEAAGVHIQGNNKWKLSFRRRLRPPSSLSFYQIPDVTVFGRYLRCYSP